MKIKKNTNSLDKIISREYLCEGDSNREEAFRHLSINWINSEEIFNRLLQEFSEFIYLDQKPVVVKIIQEALDTYFTSITKNDRYYYPHESLNDLIAALLESAYFYGQFQVINKDTNKIWSVKNDDSLNIWKNYTETLEIKECAICDKEFRSVLYQKIVLCNMKQVMKRFKHEATYLAIDLGHSS